MYLELPLYFTFTVDWHARIYEPSDTFDKGEKGTLLHPPHCRHGSGIPAFAVLYLLNHNFNSMCHATHLSIITILHCLTQITSSQKHSDTMYFHSNFVQLQSSFIGWHLTVCVCFLTWVKWQWPKSWRLHLLHISAAHCKYFCPLLHEET